jgi:CheY-like chemotaxis protein
VLVVEDDPDLAGALELELEHAGYEVRVEPDGPAALSAGADWQPDLVVLDLGLPTLDGLDICRRLRAASRVPILILTARDTTDGRIRGTRGGRRRLCHQAVLARRAARPRPIEPSPLAAVRGRPRAARARPHGSTKSSSTPCARRSRCGPRSRFASRDSTRRPSRATSSDSAGWSSTSSPMLSA